MFSEKDLAERSVEEMSLEAEELQAESKRLRESYEAALLREGELRRKSVETRPTNAEAAEVLWQETERIKDEGREMLRISLEMKLRAAEIRHRVEIHDQVQSLNNYDEVWQKAARAGRK
ncbi:MAG: hypothetical protein NTV25_03535 [Methanothrix sp.]|nr:hypothetical protein [Methanothrix sp.]